MRCCAPGASPRCSRDEERVPHEAPVGIRNGLDGRWPGAGPATPSATRGVGMKVVIVGGVAGGASCAARLRRLDEKAQIVMVERGPYISYANCGLPYHVSGVIEKESSLLVANEQMFRGFFATDVRTNCEAVAIDRKAKTVALRDVRTGEVSHEAYDKLVLAPGATSVRPPLPGIDLPGIFEVRTVPDVRAIRDWMARGTRLPRRDVQLHRTAVREAAAAGGGDRRRVHRTRDGGEPDPRGFRRHGGRDARPVAGAARPRVRASRRGARQAARHAARAG